MKNLTKVLLGVGVVGVVAVTTYTVVKMSEKKTTTVVIKDVDENDTAIYEEVEQSIITRIKEAANKKAIRILGWVMLHQKQVEAVGTIIGVCSAIFSAATAIRDFRSGFKMQKQMNTIASQQIDIMDKFLEFQNEWNDYMDATNHNIQWFEKKANAIHLDMSSLHQIEEALIPEAV